MLLRLFINLLLLATLALSFEYDEPKPSFLSRRAIDGTRGSKHFDPREDGFLDDYGFDNGQYHGNLYKGDIRTNVPGEPEVDYPAYIRIPKTAFSCQGKERGYYADEEAGCQVFHVCDEGKSASFLCPVGSLFSQRLLTCDWWTKVPCAQSQQFYKQTYDTNRYNENHVVHTPVRNDNSLEQDGQKPKAVGQQRTKFQKQEEKLELDQGHLKVSSTKYYQPQRKQPQYRSTTTTTTTTTTKAPRAPSIYPEVPFYEEIATTTTKPVETTSSSNFIETSTKSGLENNPTELTNSAESNNSAAEYDDMEGKETIGLVNSHAERNFDNVEATTLSESYEATTVGESNEVTTVVDADSVESTTYPDESIQTKESIGLVQSKVEEGIQSYDIDSAMTTESSLNSDENQFNEYTTESVFDATTFAPFLVEEKTEKTKSQEVRKMSGFIVNFVAKKSAETTTISDETSSNQELLKTSENVFTPTVPTTTELVSSEQTTILPNDQKTSDAMVESNSPFTVTLTLNDSGLSLKSNAQNPIGAELLGQLISQHENKPVDITSLEVSKSEETSTQEKEQSSAPQSNVRSYQHFRNYNFEPKRKLPSVTSTTFSSYQDYSDSYVTTTTAAPLTNQNTRSNQYGRFNNYQGNRSKSRQNTATTRPANYRTRFRMNSYSNRQNNHRQSTEDPSSRNSKSQKFNSFDTVNNDDSLIQFNQPEKEDKVETYMQRPQGSKNLKYYRPEQTVNNNQNYHVNYQTHHYPENYPPQKNDEYVNQNRNFQDSEINFENQKQIAGVSENNQNSQFIGDSQDYRNQQNYPDYQNYDSGENSEENTSPGDFGIKISMRDQNANKVIIVEEIPKVQQNADPNTINHGLQGNSAKLLYAMSQLANTDRLPRPFVTKNSSPPMNNIYDSNYNNNVVRNHKKMNNLNESQYVTPATDLTAPKLEVNEKTSVDYNFKVHSNGKFDKVKATFSASANRTKHARILNEPIRQTTQKPVQNTRNQNFQINSFNTLSSTPVPVDINQNQQQFYNQVPQTNSYIASTPASEEPANVVQNEQFQQLPETSSFSTFRPPPQEPLQINKNQELPGTSSFSTFRPSPQEPVVINQNQQFSQVPQFNLFTTTSTEPQLQVDLNQNLQYQQLPHINSFSSPSPILEGPVYNDPNQQFQQVSQVDTFSTPSPIPEVELNFNQSPQLPEIDSLSPPLPSPLDYNQYQQAPQISSINPSSSTTAVPIDYNQNQQFQSVPTQENSDYDLENKNIQFPVHSQSTDYDLQPPVENSQENNQDFSQPQQQFDFSAQPTPQTVNSNLHSENFQPAGFQHNTEATLDNSEYIELLQNLQPPRIDYSIQVNTENENSSHSSQPIQNIPPTNRPTIENIEEINNLKNLQPPKFDSNYQSSRINQKVTTKNTQFLPTVPPTESEPSSTANPQADTEFIPSLSFDFGSDEGKKEFLEAIEKGLVPDDDSKAINIDITSSTDKKIENERRSKSEVSDAMDNFKDVSEIMKGTE